jgi:MHS family proline/betaine transporter-like MFS transporter
MTQTGFSATASTGLGKQYSNPIIAGAIGNTLEWYDFAVYVYLAIFINRLFFPSADTGLILTFSTFALGYFVRPIGAIITGYIGDRLGRRTALAGTVILMAIATCGIGLLPTYATAGIAAPLLLTGFRVLQGLATGGEWGGAATFMIEHANPNRRAFITSWQQVSVLGGTLLGSGFCALLTSQLSDTEMLAYGWRIPFLFGIALGGVGLYLRYKTAETPKFEELEKLGRIVKSPLAGLSQHWPALLRIVGFTAQWSVTFTFYMNYTPTYLTRELKFPSSFGLIATTIAIAFVAFFVPFAGILSDRIGRRPVIVLAGIYTLVVTWPMMILLQQASQPLAIGILLILVVPIILISGTAPALLCELVPTGIRYSGLSVPYSISVACFGGLTPLVVTWLVGATGKPLSVTGYVMAAAVIGLVTVAFTPETAKSALR